jgi:hypothetical protein
MTEKQDYETGYTDGQKAAFRKIVETLCDPRSYWFPEWKPAVYRVAAIVASFYFDGAVAVRGENAEFGKRQLTVDDFVWTPESYVSTGTEAE